MLPATRVRKRVQKVKDIRSEWRGSIKGHAYSGGHVSGGHIRGGYGITIKAKGGQKVKNFHPPAAAREMAGLKHFGHQRSGMTIMKKKSRLYGTITPAHLPTAPANFAKSIEHHHPMGRNHF